MRGVVKRWESSTLWYKDLFGASGPKLVCQGPHLKTFYEVRQGDNRAHMKIIELHLYSN